jgi:hypothetical protein
MALNDLRLALLALPQRWNAGQLTFSIIAIPNGDPLNQPLIGSGPPFAGATLNLDAVIVGGLAGLPMSSAAPKATFPLGLMPPANAKATFQALANAVKPSVSIVPTPPAAFQRQVRKALPQTYLDARGPGTNAPGSATLTEYGCALRLVKPPPAKAATTTTWGEIISYAIRQPVLASALGLRYAGLTQLTITPPADFFRAGGYLFVTLDTSNAGDPYVVGWNANHEVLKRYAARIPPLTTASQPLFAPVLFPVDAIATSGYDDVFVEADLYADGFAQVLHCFQPDSIDASQTDPSTIAPATDAGIQIGWDDEQVMTWHRRQANNAFLRASNQEASPEAPLSVTGYRVDVRTNGGPWLSLTTVQSTLPIGLGAPTQELAIEPVATRPNSATATDTWLPLYFANWRGGSLVTRDDIPHQILSGKATPPSSVTPVVDPGAVLEYGTDYDFRVRLADLSGGGPALSDDDTNASVSGVGSWQFRRYLAPKAARVKKQFATDPNQPMALSLQRPLLGYPEALFTLRGAANQAAIAAYFSSQALSLPRPPPTGAPPPQIGVPDPDVDRVQFTVEARTPAGDATDPSLDGQYRVLYTTERTLNPLPSGLTDDDAPITVALQYADEAVAIGSTPPNSGALLIPTARDVRIRIRPLAEPRVNYYGPSVTVGLVSDVTVRASASAEETLLQQVAGHEPVTAFLFRPPDETVSNDELPDPVGYLAQSLGLASDGLTLSARPGERVVFAASQSLRNTLDPSASALTFASFSELRHNWIVALVLELERDWTWDGLAAKGFTIERATGGTFAPVGSVVIPRVLGAAAARDAQPPDPNKRTKTRIVFFDAVDPTIAAGTVPDVLLRSWRFAPHLRALADQSQTGPAEQAIAQASTFSLHLPIARPPAQVAALRSAGIALSPYKRDPAYGRTEERSRALWIELTNPIDKEQALFARFVANAPDPLLYDPPNELPQPQPQPLQIDPEFVRVITPASSDDRAGLDAMFQLERALDSDVHYLLKLPPGVNADDFELFGFNAYEFRVGHERWSTAQARFGRPLLVAGIQHPAPALRAVAGRLHDGTIAVTAPYATPVFAGRPVRQQGIPPKTTLCVTLYAQVLQVDGATHRNLLLGHAYAKLPDKPDEYTWPEVLGTATFEEKVVENVLQSFGLDPRHTPLSIIAIEFLPRGGTGMIFGDFARTNGARLANGSQHPDPAGTQFPTTRILRTSTLTPVAGAC